MVQALSDLLENEYFNENLMEEILSHFSCKEDTDVENFLKQNAITFEKQRLTRTFFLLDDSNLKKINGYFSLSIKSVDISSTDLKNSKKQKLAKSKEVKHLAGYLLAQLARDDSSQKGIGKTLIELAIERIRVAQKEVAGRFLYLDCKNELRQYYEKMGFNYMQQNPEKKNIFKCIFCYKKSIQIMLKLFLSDFL